MDGSTFTLALGTDGLMQRGSDGKTINSLWTGVWQEASEGYWKAVVRREYTVFELQNYRYRN